MKCLRFIWVVALLPFWAVESRAADRQESSLKGPVVITADSVTFDYENRVAIFSNNVQVTDPDKSMTARRMQVDFDATNNVKNVLAEGEVQIVQKDRCATAATATYDVVTGIVVLTGNPKLTRGKDELFGSRITIRVNDDFAKVEGRVRCVIAADPTRKGTASGAAP